MQAKEYCTILLAGERGSLGYKIAISVIHFTRRPSVCSVNLYSLRFKKQWEGDDCWLSTKQEWGVVSSAPTGNEEYSNYCSQYVKDRIKDFTSVFSKSGNL